MAEGRTGPWAFIRRLPWYRFAAGAVAGGAGLLVTFVLREFGLGVFLPEVAVDFVVGRIPGAIESFFIRSLGEGAKLLALLTALVIFLILPGAYAVLFRRLQAWLKNRWLVIAFYTLTSAGIILVAILPILDAGFFGSDITYAGTGFTTFSQLLAAWVYAAVLDYFLVEVAAEYPQGFSLSRRQFIVGTIGAAAIAALAFYGLASLVSKKGRLVFASIGDLLRGEVTPTSEFYVVTKNVTDPDLHASIDSWRLSIGGLVANPTAYSYADLMNLLRLNDPSVVEEFVTLECVSNEVGGNLISTAKWRGVRLASLLQSAAPDLAADWVVFTCADVPPYTAAIPLAKATYPTTIVAIEMNGDALTTDHGFPARIIVPGLYGMFHAKWITRIDAVSGAYLGYWQQKGWTNSDDGNGQIHTVAIITTPADGAVISGPVTIGGIAFAGDRGISLVQVRIDGGTWQSAALKSPPLSKLTWVLWTFDWMSPGAGSHKVEARAVDANGVPQDQAAAPPFPNGASGYDSTTLLVSQ